MAYDDGTQVIVCTAEDPNLDLIADFHEHVCKTEFSLGVDLEPLNVWQENVQAVDGRYCLNFAMIVDTTQSNRVLAGVVIEVYKNSLCAMVSYIAVADEYRGKGAARRLMNAAFVCASEVCATKCHSTLKALFIDVIHPLDAHHREGSTDGTTRQKIWAKLGFAPLDCVFVFPGTVIHKARYQWALWAEKFPQQSADSVSSDVVFAFLDDLYTAVLAMEGKEGQRKEIEEYRARLMVESTVRMGQQYWFQ